MPIRLASVDEPETSQSAPFTSRTNPTTSRAQFNIPPALFRGSSKNRIYIETGSLRFQILKELSFFVKLQAWPKKH